MCVFQNTAVSFRRNGPHELCDFSDKSFWAHSLSLLFDKMGLGLANVNSKAVLQFQQKTRLWWRHPAKVCVHFNFYVVYTLYIKCLQWTVFAYPHTHTFLMKKTQVTKQNQWYMLGEKKHSYFLHCGRGNAMCLLNYSPTIRNDHVTESWPRECGQKRYMPPPGLAHWTFYAQPLCPLFLGPPWVPPIEDHRYQYVYMSLHIYAYMYIDIYLIISIAIYLHIHKC